MHEDRIQIDVRNQTEGYWPRLQLQETGRCRAAQWTVRSSMVHAAHHLFTFADYLRVEDENSNVKHEFYDERVWAMAGGSPEHAGIAANIVSVLSALLHGKPCRVFTSGLRIRSQKTGLATYPDVSVVCGRMELDPEDPKGHTVLNPRIVVEVLSPSTEVYDRGDKLTHYQSIDTLEEIVLVAHQKREVEIHRRESGGAWSVHVATGGFELRSIGVRLSCAEVYRNPIG